MYNVLTITLNPTIDKSSSVANIKPEKKLRCEKPNYEPGGGGINVSRGLARLAVETTALFPAGGRTGNLLEELLQKEYIKVSAVPVTGETRENFIVVDISNNEQYRFGMPGAIITEEEATTIYNTIKDIKPFPEVVVISGSMPPGITADFIKKLIKLAKENGSKVILDTSGDTLKTAIEEGVYLIKPNIGELSRLTGSDHLDNDAAMDAAMEIVNKGGAEVVIISMGPQGAYLVSKKKTIHVPAPSVKKLSTVGAGDSMVAGMVAVLAKGGTLKEMMRMGVACGSAATMNPGTGLFTKNDAERLYDKMAKNKKS